MSVAASTVGVPRKETRGGIIVSIALSLISMGLLSVCISRRIPPPDIRAWKKLPLVCWITLLIYVDSIIFVFGTAILSNGFGVDASKQMCAQAVLLCLGCYMTTKVLIYYFLVERAYIIRKSGATRMKSKLYLFNAFGMLIPYCVVIVLNFYFRFAIYDQKFCRVGLKKQGLIPLIGFDVLVNVYLTSLFLLPLRSLWSYQNNPSSHTRTVALRTFIGSCCTLVSSVVNLTVLMVLRGEPGWICLMCCNADILFSVLVLHWITSKDNASTLTTPTFRASHPPSPKRLVPRPRIAQTIAAAAAANTRNNPPTYDDFGLQEYGEMQPNVTTSVTACKDRNELEEFDRIHPFPANAITVSRDLVRAVDDIRYGSRGMEGLDSGLGLERVGSGSEKAGSEVSTNNDGLARTRSGSEDGLFYGKC